MGNKKKNSNYKGADQKNGAQAKKQNKNNNQKNTKMDKSTLITIIICSALVLSLIVGIVVSVVPKKSVFVEMDFGSYGTILIEVDRNEAPKTAKNFISLVESGFYDGLTIFRAQKNFVIQGGRNDAVDIKPIVGEFDSNGHKNSISHQRGVISMARSTDPDSATSQFFITLHNSAASSLDGEYAAFGYVVEGMEVVDAIANDLFEYSINSMGFVNDENAITIVSAKIVER